MCDIYLKFFLQNCVYSKGYIDVVYKSSSQENIPNINFLSNFNELLSKTTSNNSLFTIILDDFNVRSSSWWKKDKTTEGRYTFGGTCILKQLSSACIRTHIYLYYLILLIPVFI